MPGRITDQLRRITREQGGVAPPEEQPAAAEPPSRRWGPLVALGVVLLLAGVGWLLVQRLMVQSKLEDCLMSGRKNCAPVDTSSPP